MLQKETCGALKNVQAPKMYGFGPEDCIDLVQSSDFRVLGGFWGGWFLLRPPLRV